jgi:predicted extracellular nuclease
MRKICAPILLLGTLLVPACGGASDRRRAPAGPAEPARPGSTPIHAIQGAGHVSPLLGKRLARVVGVVTAVDRHGFHMEAPEAERDGSPATSEGIYVYTAGAPGPAEGDEALVTYARVSEFGYGELTTTELADGEVDVLSRGKPLPPPVPVGPGGRPCPGEILDDDGLTVFDPVTDGLDYWESLEGMRVRLSDPICVGPQATYGMIPVVPGGREAGPRTGNGGVRLTKDDANPERIFLLGSGAPKPTTGDVFSGAVVGVVDYSYGNYVLQISGVLPPLCDGGTARVSARLLRGPEHLTVATWNVENLGPGQFRLSKGRGSRIADGIANRLGGPDIVALQEIQDGSGPDDDGIVDGRETWEALVLAVAEAGGPWYEFLEIAPRDGADGGAPGANIRVGLLYDPARVSLVPRPPPPGDPAIVPVEALRIGGNAALSHNPGRIAPGDPAWSDPEPSRRSLVAEVLFRHHRLFLVVSHLKSRRQDDPLAGAVQPPRRLTEAQRRAQAGLVNGFVLDLLAADDGAKIVALGDLNDFEFGPAVRDLAGDALTNLLHRVPAPSRYTYVHEGNSQCIDHVLVSAALHTAEIEIVHVAADFPVAGNASDHDPVLARFHLP